MFDLQSLTVFTLATLALLIVPGPAVVYIVARSIDQDRLAGLVSSLGIGLATLVHVFAAVIGLSTILMASAFAFSLVKYLGAAYLVYLGVRTLMARATHEESTVEKASLQETFTQSIIVGVLNPKTALFFLAFLPQFVDPSQGLVAIQFTALGTIFTILALIIGSIYAILAGTISLWFRDNQGFGRVQRYFSGGTYIVLGVSTALFGSDSQ